MKKILLFVALLSPFFAIAQKNVRLNYMIAINKFQRFYNEQKADSLYGMFSIQMQAALSLNKVSDLLTGLHAQHGKLMSTSIAKETSVNTVYKGVFEKDEQYIVLPLNDKDQLNGLFFQPVPAAEEASATASEKDNSNFNAQTKAGATLYGTLVMPENVNGPVPVVLLIAGSGPTDRNTNNNMGLKTDAFKMLADSLRKAGIASVRYDKRGIGESVAAMTSEADSRFGDMVDDAMNFLNKMKADKRFKKISIIGHSEGSLIGMIAANKIPVDGFVSLSGAGESADLILKKQINAKAPDQSQEAEKIINSLKAGKTIKVDNAALSPVFRESVQPYMMSWFSYDPQQAIKKLKIPVLILQGNTDMQVSPQDAEMLKAAQPKAKLVIIPEMNHVLKHASIDPDENMASYKDPSLPLVPQLCQELILFCK